MPSRAPSIPEVSAFFLVGPTAAGKTAVAQRLAERLGADILSADSMLVYRGMDVGTAKPPPAERGAVKYWGIDLVAPSEPFSVGRFLDAAAGAAASVRERGEGLIVAGGSGLYVKALTDGLESLPDADPETRARWEQVRREQGLEGLRTALKRISPVFYEAVADKDNPRRLLRALELADSGVREVPRGWRPGAEGPRIAGLRLPREALHRRIEERSRRMFESGIVEEAVALFGPDGARASVSARQAIGYAEALSFARGRLSMEEAVARTAARTRALAKRQMTWFNRQLNVDWIDVEQGMSAPDVAALVQQSWARLGPAPLVLNGTPDGAASTAAGQTLRIKDLPETLRPREQAERFGMDKVGEDVLLAILLRTGMPGRSVADLARRLIGRYRTLTAMSQATLDELASAAPGMGRVKAQVLKAALELARRMADESRPGSLIIRAPEDAANLMRERVRPLQQEVFWVLVLDAKNHIRGDPIEVTRGILDASPVHPREVFRPALQTPGAAVVLVHNHPSGDPVPSAEDVSITRRMIEAGRALGIRVLDHVVIGSRAEGREKDWFSLRESGLAVFPD